jgi:hypothetical protein
MSIETTSTGGAPLERVITPMPKSLVAAIKDYRWERRLESRAGAVRELLELGLDAARQRRALSAEQVEGDSSPAPKVRAKPAPAHVGA